MSPMAKAEYLNKIKSRYKEASKTEKKMILDEFCHICSYNRKYAIRLLNNGLLINRTYNLEKRGRKRIYSHPLILDVIREIWVKTNLPCSKRLVAILPLWMPYYAYELPVEVKRAILTISPATIDRLMSPIQSKYLKLGLATTKPGSILKKQIPIKTNQWDETRPGFLEADTVAHCGTSVSGMFVYTINCVDIATSWTELRAAWGKGEKGVLNAIASIEKHLPFPLLGFDCDNGSEFLNWHLFKHLTGRKKPVQFTRSRAYRKNDNAHIEEKNWSQVRQYLGYQRFEKISLVEKLNELYLNEWNDYFNFFIPSVKLVDKYRQGSKIIKKYDKPKTPFQRVLESNKVDMKTKNYLIQYSKNLNPFEIQKRLSSKIKHIINEVNQ